MAAVDAVVRYIVRMGDLYDDGDSITNMKLQKLLYYFQGFHVAAFEEQVLFRDRIEAWEHGPVVPSVWQEYTHLGRMPIRLVELPEGPLMGDFEAPQIQLMRSVYDRFGQFSAWRLRQMTHREMPWRAARRRGDQTQDYKITTNDLYRHFHRRLKK